MPPENLDRIPEVHARIDREVDGLRDAIEATNERMSAAIRDLGGLYQAVQATVHPMAVTIGEIKAAQTTFDARLDRLLAYFEGPEADRNVNVRLALLETEQKRRLRQNQAVAAMAGASLLTVMAELLLRVL